MDSRSKLLAVSCHSHINALNHNNLRFQHVTLSGSVCKLSRDCLNLSAMDVLVYPIILAHCSEWEAQLCAGSDCTLLRQGASLVGMAKSLMHMGCTCLCVWPPWLTQIDLTCLEPAARLMALLTSWPSLQIWLSQEHYRHHGVQRARRPKGFSFCTGTEFSH